jgi:hypothetical protein
MEVEPRVTRVLVTRQRETGVEPSDLETRLVHRAKLQGSDDAGYGAIES